MIFAPLSPKYGAHANDFRRLDSNCDLERREVAVEEANVELFKARHGNKRLRLELEHERKQRAMEQRLINQILQSIRSSEADLEQSGRNALTLSAAVSELIKSSCSQQMSCNVYIQSLAKKLVTVYSNQLKQFEDQERKVLNTMHQDEQVSEAVASPSPSSSLSSDFHGTSVTLDAVQELPEESYISDSDNEGSESDEVEDSEGVSDAEADSVIISDASEIRRILSHVVEQVAEKKELSPDVEASAGSAEVLRAASPCHASVQTESVTDERDTFDEARKLQEVVSQQSLQLLQAHDQLQTLSPRLRQSQDELVAYKDLVHQQSLLLRQMTLDLDEARQQTHRQDQVASVSVQADREVWSEARSESELFDEILIDRCSDSAADVGSSHDSPTDLAMFSSICPVSLDHRTSTPRATAESKVREMAASLRRLFHMR